MSFDEQLKVGLLGEDLVSRWLIKRGWQVLPAYQVSADHGKGPRLFGDYGQLISPDLLVFNAKKTFWVEAKFKSAFTWHRISSTWQTGIDLKHWSHYVDVAKVTPFEAWIVFLHKPDSQAKDTPPGMRSPSGLFGNSVEKLAELKHHEHANHGPSGMIYWTDSALVKLAEYSAVASPKQ